MSLRDVFSLTPRLQVHSAPLLSRTPSTLTNDDIEAVIQMATSSSRPSPDGRSGPLKDTRTQLFVGNVCSTFQFLYAHPPTPPFSFRTAFGGRISRTFSVAQAPFFVRMSLSAQTIVHAVMVLYSSLLQRTLAGPLICSMDIRGRPGYSKSGLIDYHLTLMPAFLPSSRPPQRAYPQKNLTIHPC